MLDPACSCMARAGHRRSENEKRPAAGQGCGRKFDTTISPIRDLQSTVNQILCALLCTPVRVCTSELCEPLVRAPEPCNVAQLETQTGARRATANAIKWSAFNGVGG